MVESLVLTSPISEKRATWNAGSLSLAGQLAKEPTIVVNGDLVSQIKYAGILDFHIEHRSAATMAVKAYEMQNPFGVVKLDALRLLDLRKSLYQEAISMQAYTCSRLRHLA